MIKLIIIEFMHRSIIQVIHIHLLVLLAILRFYEAQKVGRSMRLVVELLGVGGDQCVLEVADNTEADEIVVPDHIVRHHEETHELL